ncbi:hypothetical protein ACFVYD_13525 [Streptomyces sp. NPDC058301]|uniref:hypothetical protein n=1 Tax=Streptomyces sp. NPDC058301 TaxID=3346436 RepID=UPI0036E606C6
MRRFRSTTVVLGGMGVLAATLAACSHEPDRRCVDPVSHKELPKYECKSGGHGSYYYGGYTRNGAVYGGSFSRSGSGSSGTSGSSTSSGSSGGVDRGGFGGHSGSGGG